MRKGNIFKNLILFLTLALIGTIPTFAEDMNQTIILQVDPLFSIEKMPSSQDSAVANAADGTHSGVRTVYDITTNGTDYDYDITVSSSIHTTNGVVSAYGGNGFLLFANESNPPTESDVANAKLKITPNDNVIAYPVTATITSPMTINYYEGYRSYGSCYVVKLNGGTHSTFTFDVGGTPVTSTYSNTHDTAGAYKSTITFTVTPKI